MDFEESDQAEEPEQRRERLRLDVLHELAHAHLRGPVDESISLEFEFEYPCKKNIFYEPWC